MDGIAALTAQFVGVDGGVGLLVDQIVAEIGVIHGVSAKTMNPDDDQILIRVRSFPGPIPKCLSIRNRRHGIVLWRAAVIGDEKGKDQEESGCSVQHE